jgi:hypothetical protein
MYRRPVLQHRKIDPEVLARFWPPPLETFFVGVLRSLQILCLLGSGVALLAHFTSPPLIDATWLPFAIFFAHLLSFYRGLWLEQNLRPNDLFVTAAELLFMFIAMWAVWTVFIFNGTLFSLTFLLDFVFIAAAWQMGRSWLRLYFFLFVQPYELSTEEGGVSTLEERSVFAIDHREAYAGLRSGWLWMAGLQILLTVAGVAIVAAYEKNKPGSADFSFSLIIFAAIHLFLGLPLLAWARLRYLRTNWRLSRLDMPPRLSTRWGFYTLVLALLALLPALLLTQLDFSNLLNISLPAPQPRAVALPTPNGTPGSFIQITPIAPPPRPEPSEPFETPTWLSILVLSFVVTTIIFAAFLILERAGWVGPRWRKLAFGGFFKSFWEWLRSLFRWGRKREGFEKEVSEGTSFSLFGRFRRERLPNDPRGQVRFHYRQLIERARRAGLPRRTGQTPDEYADYLAPELEVAPGQALTPQLENLTNLYDEARFSPHPIDESQAQTARQHTEQLNAHLRLKARQKRGAIRKPEEKKEEGTGMNTDKNGPGSKDG